MQFNDFNITNAHHILHELGELTSSEVKGLPLYIKKNDVTIGLNFIGKITNSFSANDCNLKEFPNLIKKIGILAKETLSQKNDFTEKEIDNAIKGIEFYSAESKFIKKEELNYVDQAIASLKELKQIVAQKEIDRDQPEFIDLKELSDISKESLGPAPLLKETKTLINQIKGLTDHAFPLSKELESQLITFFDNEILKDKTTYLTFKEFFDQILVCREKNLQLLQQGVVPLDQDQHNMTLFMLSLKIQPQIVNSKSVKLKGEELENMKKLLQSLEEIGRCMGTNIHTDTFNFLDQEKGQPRHQHNIKQSQQLADQLITDLKTEKNSGTVSLKTNEILLRNEGFIPRGLFFQKADWEITQKNLEQPIIKGSRHLSFATVYGQREDIKVELDLSSLGKLDSKQCSIILDFIKGLCDQQGKTEKEQFIKKFSSKLDFLDGEKLNTLISIATKFDDTITKEIITKTLKLSHPIKQETSFYSDYLSTPLSYLGKGLSVAYNYVPSFRTKSLTNFRENEFDIQMKNIQNILKLITPDQSKVDTKTKEKIEKIDTQMVDLVDYFINNDQIFTSEIKSKLQEMIKQSSAFHLHFSEFLVEILYARDEVINDLKLFSNLTPVSHLKNNDLNKAYSDMLKDVSDPKLKDFIVLLYPSIIKQYVSKYKEQVYELKNFKNSLTDVVKNKLSKEVVNNKSLIQAILDPKEKKVGEKLHAERLVKIQGEQNEIALPTQFLADLKRFGHLKLNDKTIHDQNNELLKIEQYNELEVCYKLKKDLGETNFKNVSILITQTLPTQSLIDKLIVLLQKKYEHLLSILGAGEAINVDIKKNDVTNKIECHLNSILELKNQTLKDSTPIGYLVWDIKVDFPQDTSDLQKLPLNLSLQGDKPTDAPQLNISYHFSEPFDTLKNATSYLKNL